MAEFTETMRQAKRLCAAHDGMCSMRNCPLDNGEACRLNIDLDGEDYNELERPMPAEVAEKLRIKPISRQSEDVHNGCIGCKYEKRSVFEAPCAQCRGWTMITCDPNRRGVLWEAAK